MSRVEETRSLADPEGAIAAYLAAEDDFTALSEFETFVKERGLLDEDAAVSPLKDLQTWAFRMTLDFQLNRYRDIARDGGLLASSSLIIAPSGRPSYVRILRLIGESDLKLDNVYEAERYLRSALEADPQNLDVLMGLERCYRRLNEEGKAAEIKGLISRLTSPAVIELAGRVVNADGSFKLDLVTSGGPRTLRLEFAPSPEGGHPLVSIFLDGRVVWEGNGDTGSAEFPATLTPGPATLEITALGGAVSLHRITQAAAAPR
jgi:tetratricopeptide (TPR) repeat protein